MPFTKWKNPSQPATFISLRALGVAESQGRKRMEELGRAASQGHTLDADFDFDEVGFVLATREQIEEAGFLEEFNIGLAMSCTGKGTKTFNYRRPVGPGFGSAVVPVCWAAGRMSSLLLTMPFHVATFWKKRSVLIHCNASFHRAPLGLAMVAKMLFGCEPGKTMSQLAMSRTIYYMYEEGKSFDGHDLWNSLQWAKALPLWSQVAGRVASAWSQGAAGSSGQGAAASSGQGAAASSWRGAPASSWQVKPASSWRVAAATSGRGVAASQGKSQPRAMPEYLYRAMTVGLTEFNPRAPPTDKGLKLAVIILDAVETGSQKTSPFLHFSLNFWEAHKWQSRAKAVRNEKGTILCRVRTAELKEMAASQGVEGEPDLENGLKAGEFLDLSTNEATKKWLSKYATEDAVQDRLSTIRRSQSCREVAVAWRGCIRQDIFEVLDDNGSPLYFLGEGRFLHRTCDYM